MSRRLLVLAYFFPPLAGGGVHRVLSFARHLPEQGWDVTVVCAGEDDYWVRDESLLASVPAATEVIRVAAGGGLASCFGLRGGRGTRRGGTFAGLRKMSDWWLLPDAYSGWARRAQAAAATRLAAGGVDALLTTSPPDSVHLAGAALARRFGVAWVADFRDPWVGLRFREPPTAWHRARHEAMERRVLSQADLVLAASRTHLEQVATLARRAEHLPNGFEPEAGGPPEAADADHFRLAFTGTLSLMEDAGTLLEAVHDVLAGDTGMRRRLRVDLAGPYDLDYEDRSLALGLKGIVRFPGALPHAGSRRLQRAADVLLLWKPRGGGYRTMVPGKLYEYLDSGRPIVALLPERDEAAELVRRAGGTVLPPGDRAALARELETRYTHWMHDGRAPDDRPGWLDEHARPRLAARLAGLLGGLGGGRT